VSATAVHVLETVQRHSALGLRFWDVAAATSRIDGLEVDVYPVLRPQQRRRARPNLSFIYGVAELGGLALFEHSDIDPPAAWSVPLRRYRVEVRDPRDRFLPIAFDADLPARGLFHWRAPWLSPPQSISLPTETGSPPPLLLDRIPLFSSPSRPVPEPLAVIYAQLAFLDERPCAWALLQAAIGDARGLGLADSQGRVAVMFPYPPPPRVPLTSPPSPRDDFHWDVELTALLQPPASPPSNTPPPVADLADVLRQLDFPQQLVGSLDSPTSGLDPQPLEYRVPLTVRTAAASTSRLYVSTV
jgi:hypothetical protein